MVIIFRDHDSFDRVKSDVVCTPAIEGGVGPVFIGDPSMSSDGRCAIAYPWAEVDVDWLQAYTTGENPPLTVVDALPADWGTYESIGA